MEKFLSVSVLLLSATLVTHIRQRFFSSNRVASIKARNSQTICNSFVCSVVELTQSIKVGLWAFSSFSEFSFGLKRAQVFTD